MDPTPWADEEYPIPYLDAENLGGTDGPMNVARALRGFSGDAPWDAFSVLLHEIGHALGLRVLPNVNTEVGDGDIDITAPRPFAGASIPVINSNHLSLTQALMYSSFTEFERKLLSEADILALAQVNGWEQLDLSPSRTVSGDIALGPAILAAAVIALGRSRGLLQ